MNRMQRYYEIIQENREEAIKDENTELAEALGYCMLLLEEEIRQIDKKEGV